jgi:hypothetical protein
MEPLAEQYLAAVDKFEAAAPDKILLTYISSAMSRNDQKALYQLTSLQAFLDNRLAPIDTDSATLFLCKRMAEKMVKKGIWPEDVLGQFSKWPPEADAGR